MDPCTGRTSRNYHIPEELRGELQEIIDQMLRYMIIRYSSSPLNSPILLVKNKKMHPGKKIAVSS
jgi:hypothetical protein